MAHERRGGFTIIARPIREPCALESYLFGEFLRRIPLCNCFVEEREGFFEIAERDGRVAPVRQGVADGPCRRIWGRYVLKRLVRRAPSPLSLERHRPPE